MRKSAYNDKGRNKNLFLFFKLRDFIMEKYSTVKMWSTLDIKFWTMP